MTDVDNLPPTRWLALELLVARHRLGERLWTFPSSCGSALRALEQAGLVIVMSGCVEHTLRARLTEQGIREAVSLSYTPPHLTLAQGIDTLPASNDELHDWAARHGLGLSAGVGAVIEAVRRDLRKLPGGQP